MKVGIFYIGIAKYSVFWEDFYLSSEKYFLPGVEKKYLVFSDEEIKRNENVTVYYQESFGSWEKNTMYRFKLFLEHQDDYSDCDYLYFFNANTLFKRKVTPKEFIPGQKDNFLIALSPNYYRGLPKNRWPYERRTESCACIPFGQGYYYYQGAVFGGRKKEFLELLKTCNEWVIKDEEKGIVAFVVDESHLNKYLLDKKIKVLGTKYGKGEELGFTWYCKIILRDKYRVLGKYYADLSGKKTEKFSLKHYSFKRFFSKIVNRVLFKYRNYYS